MLDTIRESWAWHGVDPVQVVSTNAFGNVIFRSKGGGFWRQDWDMAMLVEKALMTLGPTAPDRCYCLKIPAALGGAYEAPNFGTISRRELIASAGDLARQIKDLPDGSKVRWVAKDRP